MATTGSVTIGNIKLSAVNGTAFIDFTASGTLTNNTGKLLYLTDSVGATISGYLKAAGTGETLGSEIATGTLTAKTLYKITAEGETSVFPTYKAGQSVTTTAATSGSTGHTIADDADLHLGVSNLTVSWDGSVSAWASGSNINLIQKRLTTSANHFLLYVTATGIPIFYLSGSGKTLINKPATTALTTTTGRARITASVTRETAGAAGSIEFFENGSKLGDTVTIDATATPPLFPEDAGALYISGTNSSRTAAQTYGAQLYNRALSAAEVLSLHTSGVAAVDQWGDQTIPTSGCILSLTPSTVRLLYWYDASTNNLDASYPASGSTVDYDYYFVSAGTETCTATDKVQQVLTPSATGTTIVSTKRGHDYNWLYQQGTFDYNDESGYTYSIDYGGMVEQGIYSRLTGQSTVTSLVSTKIFSGSAPQNVSLPYITFIKISNDIPHAMINDPNLTRPRIQLSCWSTDYAQVKSIADVARVALQDYALSTGGVTFGRIFFDNETDITETDPDTNKVIHHVAQDYLAWHY
ncbi:MAG: DUF3168 domain-containing protein [Magnetococcus sp. WYHC-3]